MSHLLPWILVGLLCVGAQARIYCQSQILGKYVTQKNYKGGSTDSINQCLDTCQNDFFELQKSEESAFQLKCYKKIGRELTLLETFGEQLPAPVDCQTFWQDSQNNFDHTKLETLSMCKDHFRVNTLYKLQTEHYKSGFSVDLYFNGEYILSRTENPLCSGELVGQDIKRNPKFSSKSFTRQQCLDKCQQSYDKYINKSEGENRELHCRYAGEHIKTFGQLGDKKDCLVINAKTQEIENHSQFETASMCQADFRRNRIYELNKKYEGEVFHINLVFNNELIRDYYHKVKCEYEAHGIQPRAIKSSRMVTTQGSCLEFCQNKQTSYQERADGDERWGNCYLNNKEFAKLGQRPQSKKEVLIIDRETKEPVYRPFLASTRSIAKYYFKSYKHSVIRKLNKDEEFHWDIIYDNELLMSYDRDGMCRVKYALNGQTKGSQKKAVADKEHCQQMCLKTYDILSKNFSSEEIQLSCRFKAQEIAY